MQINTRTQTTLLDLKIFVSYSRMDAGNFAEKIHDDMRKEGHDVFMDSQDIKIGSKWNESIKDNITNCDIFLVIVTPSASRSEFIKKEILQAHEEKKIIIPCYYEKISKYPEGILNDYQGIEFKDEYNLALKLYKRIDDYGQYQKDEPSSMNSSYRNPNTKIKGSFRPSMERRIINYIASLSLAITSIAIIYVLMSFWNNPSAHIWIYTYLGIVFAYLVFAVWIFIRGSIISYVISLFVTSVATLMFILNTIFFGSGDFTRTGNLAWVVPSFITIFILALGLIRLRRF